MSEINYSFGAAGLEAASALDQEWLPRQPKTVRDTGLERTLIVELVAKNLLIVGKSHLPALTGKLRLPLNVLREVLDFMVAEQLAEVSWRGESDIDVQYQLTGAGRQRAAAWLERCAYAGPAPVTLESYRAMAERQRGRERVSGADIAAVFGDQHLDPAMLNQIGAALCSGRALLLYGPPGGGKTTLARKLGELAQGLVALPYALLVGQEIVQLYDPALHEAPPPALSLQARLALERRSSDLRWVLCRRALLRVGAELGEDMLDLRHDAFSGSYQAPLQLKANHGMLVIDDLGRQRVGAADLLQRYMQPLDTGLDQLSLRGGHKVGVPFDVTLVFVTNLAPRSLLDASLLRRLGYKIHVGALGADAYAGLFRQQCHAARIACDEAALGYLFERLHGPSGYPLMASYPQELLSRVADFAAFGGVPPRLTEAALEQAWDSLFAGCEPQ